MTYPLTFSDTPALTISSAYKWIYPYNETATGFDYKTNTDDDGIANNILHGIAIGH